MSEDVERLRALSEAATPGPWATLAYWPREIVPADQERLPLGAASDPVADLRYAQPIARSEYSDTPGEWRDRFPHRRLDETLANADAALIVAAVNYVRAALSSPETTPASDAGLRAAVEALIEPEGDYGLAGAGHTAHNVAIRKVLSLMAVPASPETTPAGVLPDRCAALEEFLAASDAVEAGVVDFTLHASAVERLRAARKALG